MWSHNPKFVGLRIWINGIYWVSALQGYPAEVAEHLGALGSLGDKLLEPFLSIYLPAGGSVHGSNPESHDSSAVLL